MEWLREKIGIFFHSLQGKIEVKVAAKFVFNLFLSAKLNSKLAIHSPLLAVINSN